MVLRSVDIATRHKLLITGDNNTLYTVCIVHCLVMQCLSRKEIPKVLASSSARRQKVCVQFGNYWFLISH